MGKDPRKLFDEWNKYLESQFIHEGQAPKQPDEQTATEITKPAATVSQEQQMCETLPLIPPGEPTRLDPVPTVSIPQAEQPVQDEPARGHQTAALEATSETAPPVHPTSLVSIRVPSFLEYVPLLRQEHGLPDPIESDVHQDEDTEQPAPRFRHQRQDVNPDAIVPPALEDVWARLPKHLRYLAEWGDDEVAQRYYKSETKESRQELIERLTNPVLSLEDTARLLGVCPATVRRYTDRGWLHHFRTEGNQRRFRLSDIVLFLEEQANRPARSKRYKQVNGGNIHD